MKGFLMFLFFFSSRRRHTRCYRDWSSDVCSSDLLNLEGSLGRDLLIFAKHLTLAGKVDGAIKMKGDMLTINSSAQVTGPIRYEGNKEPEVSPQAKLASPVDY